MKESSKSAKHDHLTEPDYSRPVFKLNDQLRERIMQKIVSLYGEDKSKQIFNELYRIIKVYYAYKTPEMLDREKEFDKTNRFTEKDIILITYGDLVYSPHELPLVTLAEIAKQYFKGVFNTLHLLPFFPYSSDRGFAVMDFEEVDPHLGHWEDILALKSDFRLMFDGVFNHVSSKSRWFQEFLNQNPYYQDFFTVFSTKEQVSADHLALILRPRTSEVLTEFKTLNGPRLVWTTFSPDQIDLNFGNPRVMLRMIEILLTYVRHGADIIRLDAVTYLWEELGTTCAHLEQNHVTIKLFRDLLDAVAPHVALITETNVTHEDNIRYFGNGEDEAQMIYNFALPPLVIHAFQNANAGKLTQWAAGLRKISESATYFNFLDSHDGIGLMAVKNILSSKEIEMMALRIVEHGGFISYKAEGDGSEIPYELNITWYSALNRDDDGEDIEIKIARYLASRSIALILIGVPGIYLHGLLGSVNDAEAVLEDGYTRSINRKKINKSDLLQALNNRQSNIYRVASALIRLLHYRKQHKAFHPNAAQIVLNLSEKLFALIRISPDGAEVVLAIVNVTNTSFQLTINLQDYHLQGVEWQDILSKQVYSSTGGQLSLKFKPYQIFWLQQQG